MEVNAGVRANKWSHKIDDKKCIFCIAVKFYISNKL